MKIERFAEYNLYDLMTDDFINYFDIMIIESDQSKYNEMQKKIISDLKLNSKFVLTYGVGLGATYPIVEKLMRNMPGSIEITLDKIVLLSIAALTIIYLEEKKYRTQKEEEILTKDSKSMLEELKMNGIGNGIVKKLIKGLKSIRNLFSIIGKHIGAVAAGVIDMFAYTSLMIPVLNGVLAIIGKYDLNLDTLCQNFIGLAVGVGTIISKHGIIEILKKIKGKFNINPNKVISEIEVPVIQKFTDFRDDVDDTVKLIKEQ